MVSGSAIYSIDYTEFLLANSKSCKVLSSYLEGILPRVESSDGEASLKGSASLSSEPSGHWRLSVVGLNSRVPARVRATVISGLVTKQ